MDLNFVDSTTSFFVSTRMTFQPTTHTEEVCLKNKTEFEERERIITGGFQTHKQLGKPRSVLGEVY